MTAPHLHPDQHPALFCSRRPAPPLDRFIDQLWYWEGAPPAHAKDRVLPNGCANLIINLAEDEVRNYDGADDAVVHRHSGAILCGARSRYSVIDTDEQREVLGICFHPGGTWPFFEAAGDELQNTHISLRDLWGSAGATLRERVLAQPTPVARLRYIENELTALALRPLTRRAEIDFALARLARAPADHSIAELSERVGLSTRRFTRLFSMEIGLTPKLYARVTRFQRMLELMREPAADWSQLAQQCGYFDQSHLIRDCKSMSGFTPCELALRRRGNNLHVAI
jgi:AraC-like DNA-binding protein